MLQAHKVASSASACRGVGNDFTSTTSFTSTTLLGTLGQIHSNTANPFITGPWSKASRHPTGDGPASAH
ncbi:hypothetical protein GCM10010302_55140 [Streptomyces polychromogenes]|uniref:Uncharacterized protein n=1 Tax=Streptomyces polychromogenes TaxID=67342 RepID=A0ABN0VL16_9ACTN